MVQKTQIIIDFNCSKTINVNMQSVKRRTLSKDQRQWQLAVGGPTTLYLQHLIFPYVQRTPQERFILTILQTQTKRLFLYLNFDISRWGFLNHKQAKYTVKHNTLMSHNTVLHVSVPTNHHPAACRTHLNTQTQQERKSLVLFKVYKNKIKDTYFILKRIKIDS